MRWFRRRTRPAERGVDVRAVAIRHLIRGHDGMPLLCAECVADTKAADR